MPKLYSGCISQGKTKEEAIGNVKEAILVYMSSAGARQPAGAGRTLRNPADCRMNALPSISGRDCAKALAQAVFRLVRQEGSHMVLRRDDPFSQVVVPDHRELDRGTFGESSGRLA